MAWYESHLAILIASMGLLIFHYTCLSPKFLTRVRPPGLDP
jgi:hypothetical protein